MKGTIATTDVQGLVKMLVARYGSVHEAGRAYDERFGYLGRVYAQGNGGSAYNGNGPRLFNRILKGETQTVSERTFDQIETLEAS